MVKKEIKAKENFAKYDEVLYTISEVATLLKVNKNFIYKLINNGYLRSIQLGCRKVTKKSLLEFLDNYDGNTEFDENTPVHSAITP